MVIFLKRQETRTEHVAIETSKCVPSGIFHRVQNLCQVSILMEIFSILCQTTLLAQPMMSSVSKITETKINMISQQEKRHFTLL